jgi:hypothetical protein
MKFESNEAFLVFLKRIKKEAKVLNSPLKKILTEEIDINSPDWEEKMMNQAHPADESGLRPQIESFFEELVENFEYLTFEQRARVIDLMASKSYLMQSAVLKDDMGTASGFRKALILFVIQDQGADTRDAILALRSIWDHGKKHGFDIDVLFREMAGLSSDEDKYGMGSTRDLFNNYL